MRNSECVFEPRQYDAMPLAMKGPKPYHFKAVGADDANTSMGEGRIHRSPCGA